MLLPDLLHKLEDHFSAIEIHQTERATWIPTTKNANTLEVTLPKTLGDQNTPILNFASSQLELYNAKRAPLGETRVIANLTRGSHIKADELLLIETRYIVAPDGTLHALRSEQTISQPIDGALKRYPQQVSLQYPVQGDVSNCVTIAPPRNSLVSQVISLDSNNRISYLDNYTISQPIDGALKRYPQQVSLQYPVQGDVSNCVTIAPPRNSLVSHVISLDSNNRISYLDNYTISQKINGSITIHGIPKTAVKLLGDFKLYPALDEDLSYLKSAVAAAPPPANCFSGLMAQAIEYCTHKLSDPVARAQLVATAFSRDGWQYLNSPALQKIVDQIPPRYYHSFQAGLRIGNCHDMVTSLYIAQSHAKVATVCESGPAALSGSSDFCSPGHAQLRCLESSSLVLDPTIWAGQQLRNLTESMIARCLKSIATKPKDLAAAYTSGAALREALLTASICCDEDSNFNGDGTRTLGAGHNLKDDFSPDRELLSKLSTTAISTDNLAAEIYRLHLAGCFSDSEDSQMFARFRRDYYDRIVEHLNCLEPDNVALYLDPVWKTLIKVIDEIKSEPEKKLHPHSYILMQGGLPTHLDFGHLNAIFSSTPQLIPAFLAEWIDKAGISVAPGLAMILACKIPDTTLRTQWVMRCIEIASLVDKKMVLLCYQNLELLEFDFSLFSTTQWEHFAAAIDRVNINHDELILRVWEDINCRSDNIPPTGSAVFIHDPVMIRGYFRVKHGAEWQVKLESAFTTVLRKALDHRDHWSAASINVYHSTTDLAISVLSGCNPNLIHAVTTDLVTHQIKRSQHDGDTVYNLLLCPEISHLIELGPAHYQLMRLDQLRITLLAKNITRWQKQGLLNFELIAPLLSTQSADKTAIMFMQYIINNRALYETTSSKPLDYTSRRELSVGHSEILNRECRFHKALLILLAGCAISRGRYSPISILQRDHLSALLTKEEIEFGKLCWRKNKFLATNALNALASNALEVTNDPVENITNLAHLLLLHTLGNNHESGEEILQHYGAATYRFISELQKLKKPLNKLGVKSRLGLYQKTLRHINQLDPSNYELAVIKLIIFHPESPVTIQSNMRLLTNFDDARAKVIDPVSSRSTECDEIRGIASMILSMGIEIAAIQSGNIPVAAANRYLSSRQQDGFAQRTNKATKRGAFKSRSLPTTRDRSGDFSGLYEVTGPIDVRLVDHKVSARLGHLVERRYTPQINDKVIEAVVDLADISTPSVGAPVLGDRSADLFRELELLIQSRQYPALSIYHLGTLVERISPEQLHQWSRSRWARSNEFASVLSTAVWRDPAYFFAGCYRGILNLLEVKEIVTRLHERRADLLVFARSSSAERTRGGWRALQNVLSRKNRYVEVIVGD
jgi:hypothetical protein